MYKFLALLATLVALSTLAVAQKTKCDIPPELWCDDDQVMDLCGTKDSCATYAAGANKLKVTFIYEAMCPYCQRLFTSMIYPKVWQKLADLIEIDLVPYGNARTVVNGKGNYTFTCQHGADHGAPECRANIVHNCLIQHYPQPVFYMPYIYCMEQILVNSCVSECSIAQVDAATETCFKQQNFTTAESTAVTTCRDGQEGQDLLYQAGVRTGALWPEKHEFTPWLVFNDVSTAGAQNFEYSVDKFICWTHKGAPINPYCSS